VEISEECCVQIWEHYVLHTATFNMYTLIHEQHELLIAVWMEMKV
jgi:hypothetical protein